MLSDRWAIILAEELGQVCCLCRDCGNRTGWLDIQEHHVGTGVSIHPGSAELRPGASSPTTRPRRRIKTPRSRIVDDEDLVRQVMEYG